MCQCLRKATRHSICSVRLWTVTTATTSVVTIWIAHAHLATLAYLADAKSARRKHICLASMHKAHVCWCTHQSLNLEWHNACRGVIRCKGITFIPSSPLCKRGGLEEFAFVKSAAHIYTWCCWLHYPKEQRKTRVIKWTQLGGTPDRCCK